MLNKCYLYCYHENYQNKCNNNNTNKQCYWISQDGKITLTWVEFMKHFTKLPFRTKLAHIVSLCELECSLQMHTTKRVAWISVITQLPQEAPLCRI